MNLPRETNHCLLKTMMRRNFFTALVSSLIWTTTLYAQEGFHLHGQWNYESARQLFQENSEKQNVSDLLRAMPIEQLTLVYMDLTYSVKKKCDVHMRVGHNSDPLENFWNDQMFSTPSENGVQFLSAYADYTLSPFVHVQTGLMPLQKMSATHENPRDLFIDRALHHMLSLNDQALGLSLSTTWYPISLQLSVWNQRSAQEVTGFSGGSFSDLSDFSDLTTTWMNTLITSSDYQNKNLKPGYSAAFAFVPSEYDEIGSAVSIGVLSAPLKQSYIIATVGALDTDTSVGVSLYNHFFNYHANYLAYWKQFVLNLSLEYDHITLSEAPVFGSEAYVGANVFQKDAMAVAYSAVLAHTFYKKGDYQIDRLSGQLAQKPIGLTIGCGYGSKTQKDAFAFLSMIGQDDWLSSTYTGISGAGRLIDVSWQDSDQSDHQYRLVSLDNTIPTDESTPYATQGNLNLQGQDEHTFQIKSKSLSVIVNYQFNEAMEWKNEWTYTHHQKIIFGQDYFSAAQIQPAYVASMNWNKTATFRSELSVFF